MVRAPVAAWAASCALVMLAKGPSLPEAFGAASLPLQLSLPLAATKKSAAGSAASAGAAISIASRRGRDFMPEYAIESHRLHKKCHHTNPLPPYRERGMGDPKLNIIAPRALPLAAPPAHRRSLLRRFL